MHEQWISNVAIEYARTQVRRAKNAVAGGLRWWQGSDACLHQRTTESAGARAPWRDPAPAYLAIPRRNRSLPSNTESEMQPKPNPFKTRHLSILSSTLRAQSPITSFNQGCTLCPSFQMCLTVVQTFAEYQITTFHSSACKHSRSNHANLDWKMEVGDPQSKNPFI